MKNKLNLDKKLRQLAKLMPFITSMVMIYCIFFGVPIEYVIILGVILIAWLIFGDLDKFKEFTVGSKLLGVEGKMRENVENFNVNDNKLSELNARVILDLIQRLGRWPSKNSDAYKLRILKEYEDILNEKEDLKESICGMHHEWVIYDYCVCIIEAVREYIKKKNTMTNEVDEKFTCLRKENAGKFYATPPKELRNLFYNECNLQRDGQIDKLLNYYDHYIINRAHFNDYVWRTRDSWGHLLCKGEFTKIKDPR